QACTTSLHSASCEAAALSVEETLVVVAPDALSIRVANLCDLCEMKVKYLEKVGIGVKFPKAACEGVECEMCVKKRTDVVLLEMDTLFDEG
ncbi:hypothetical protein Tco_1023013, partial [Tanacetum coccineum]